MSTIKEISLTELKGIIGKPYRTMTVADILNWGASQGEYKRYFLLGYETSVNNRRLVATYSYNSCTAEIVTPNTPANRHSYVRYIEADDPRELGDMPYRFDVLRVSSKGAAPNGLEPLTLGE